MVVLFIDLLYIAKAKLSRRRTLKRTYCGYISDDKDV